MVSQKIAEQILEAHLCRVNYSNYCIFNFNLQFCSKSVLGVGGGGDGAKAPLRLGGPYLTQHNILTLKTTTAQVVETLVTVNNSPIQDYAHPRDTRTIMLPLLKK